MGFALIFSGQGMLHPGMLPWLEDDELVKATQAALGVTDWRAQWQVSGWAARNAQAQVLLTGLDLAAWTQLSRVLPRPAAVAGYSVGELAAFAAADVYDSRTALTLAAARARAMDRCAEAAPGGLMAVSGLSRARIEQLCIDTGVALAIDNGSHAVVLGGPRRRLIAALQMAQDVGARVTKLEVSVASHTPWMQAAAEEFAQILSQYSLRRPSVPLFANSGDRIDTDVQAAYVLSMQIAHTVRWSACMDALHERQVRCVLEVGPGSALARLWNERFPETPARSVDEFRAASAVADWVMRNLG